MQNNTNNAQDFVKSFRPLLSREQEVELFSKWREAGTDDPYLMEIVTAYSPIIRRSIRELSGYKMPEDEMLSEGLVALIEAARRFDLKEGVRFATYAKICVRGTMQGFITKNFFQVHVNTNHKKKNLFYALRKLIAIELHRHGSFTLSNEQADELAKEHGTDRQQVFEMYHMFHQPLMSLQATVDGSEDDDHITYGETIASDGPNSEEQVINQKLTVFQRSIIHDALKNVLTPRERRIFVAQMLSEKEDHRTLEELGVEFDISKERVRQLRRAATHKVYAELDRLTDEMGINPADMLSD